ncbi:MAG TPA: regulatory iron-sulfur-containing complex subunit RicT [Candidatus Omnitrophota bacterium]|nr:regulatory iron-sulfur-containing complex subunit RicT [Candidatus Omnitrophota bacterium]HPD84784.1 regulatory iron-sulfur-containing complex subunit RicT [Candidatus Omnitrophota bacterium]HRZ03642.1 regulatory iron-sulfur-containing complex subunit RicT [Candidatus Omnitrophota bacterium]
MGTIQVKLGKFRPVAFFNSGELKCNRGDIVILEVDRGVEYGEVLSDAHFVCKAKVESVGGNVIRLATAEDLKRIEDNKKKAREAIATAVKKIAESKLDMQIVKCEYSFDGAKVIFFFTAEGRVDFRELVKDLARIFKVRIELKQIGVRDKSKVVGGFGICGRDLCCASYMKSFHPLTIKMSKEQGLPLNPSKISGTCGRIKCCMAYEYAVYREYSRDMPRLGEKINTPDGKGKVVDLNILRRCATVDLGDGKFIKMTYPAKE